MMTWWTEHGEVGFVHLPRLREGWSYLLVDELGDGPWDQTEDGQHPDMASKYDQPPTVRPPQADPTLSVISPQSQPDKAPYKH